MLSPQFQQLDYNRLFRRFVGLSIDPAVRDAKGFTKNCERLPAGDVAASFLSAVLNRPRVRVRLLQRRMPARLRWRTAP
jgi:hypothetical protein